MIMIIIYKSIAKGLSGDIVDKSPLKVSFLNLKLVQKLCQSYVSADIAYQSYSACGLEYFRSDMAEPAFLEFGGALQICHFQVSNEATRSWQWAARMVESTNKLVVALNEINCHDLVPPLLEKVGHELRALSPLMNCAREEDPQKLSNWCSAMYCPKRQAKMANLYKGRQMQMETVHTQH